jgi:hypothetical protein
MRGIEQRNQEIKDTHAKFWDAAHKASTDEQGIIDMDEFEAQMQQYDRVMMQMAKERDRALLRFFGICLLLIVACIVAIIAVNTGLPQGIY